MKGGLFEGDKLKLNSYDFGVDIELADAFGDWVSSILGESRVARSSKPR